MFIPQQKCSSLDQTMKCKSILKSTDDISPITDRIAAKNKETIVITDSNSLQIEYLKYSGLTVAELKSNKYYVYQQKVEDKSVGGMMVKINLLEPSLEHNRQVKDYKFMQFRVLIRVIRENGDIKWFDRNNTVYINYTANDRHQMFQLEYDYMWNRKESAEVFIVVSKTDLQLISIESFIRFNNINDCYYALFGECKEC